LLALDDALLFLFELGLLLSAVLLQLNLGFCQAGFLFDEACYCLDVLLLDCRFGNL
jgi:hypothetical protein